MLGKARTTNGELNTLGIGILEEPAPIFAKRIARDDTALSEGAG